MSAGDGRTGLSLWTTRMSSPVIRGGTTIHETLITRAEGTAEWLSTALYDGGPLRKPLPHMTGPGGGSGIGHAAEARGRTPHRSPISQGG